MKKIWIVVFMEASWSAGEDSSISDVQVFTEQPDDSIYNDTRGVSIFEKEIEL